MFNHIKSINSFVLRTLFLILVISFVGVSSKAVTAPAPLSANEASDDDSNQAEALEDESSDLVPDPDVTSENDSSDSDSELVATSENDSSSSDNDLVATSENDSSNSDSDVAATSANESSDSDPDQAQISNEDSSTAEPDATEAEVANNLVLLAPQQGSSVTVSNDMVQEWWDNYKKKSGVKLAEKKEFCKPDPVVLQWESADPAASDASSAPPPETLGYEYFIYLSTDSNFKDYDNIRIFSTTETSYELYNLFSGTTYYWKVRASGSKGVKVSGINEFRTKEGPRTLLVKGAYNTRDMGGYITSSGKRIRQGLIYRSGNFDHIKDSGKKTIELLEIKTQLDLRKEDEGKTGKKTLPVENYFHKRGHAYERIWKNERRAKRTIEIMKTFTHKENYPIVFHCIYGRDRAGTIAFLLNGLLGASKKDLYRDYELTFLSRNSGSHGKEKIKRFDDFYKKIRTYKNKDESLQYNIKAYLTDYGMTEEEIKNIEDIMLE